METNRGRRVDFEARAILVLTALKTTKNNANLSGLKQFSVKELVRGFVSEAKSPNNKRFGCLKSYF